MTEFKKFYLWGMNAKFFMGLYFTALVFFTGALTLFFGGETFRVMELFQMLVVSIVIAFSQVIFIPDSSDFSKSIFSLRSALWLLLSTGLTIIVSLWGGWLSDFPKWCLYLLWVLMPVGFVCMLIGIKFEQEADTIHLNEELKKYNKV